LGNYKETSSPGESEFSCIRAALGGGFFNTSELKPMKYKEAMATADKEKWIIAVKEEWDRMVKNQVFWLVKRSEIVENSKILTSTWEMKKKSNG